LNVIEVVGLRKSFGKVEVLHGIDFVVRRGEWVGFLGPNGSGKTTTIRTLLALLRKSGGRVSLFGHEISAGGPSLRRRIGYLPADLRFPRHMTGRQVLRYHARVRRRKCDEKIAELEKAFDLDLDKRIRTLSTGMKQKLGLIQALMHEPELVVLDEPTTGLDPLVREAAFTALRRFVAGGGSILFSSHSLGEVEQLCDRVVILRNGRLVEDQTIAALRKRALRRVTVEFAAPESIPETFPDCFRVGKREGRRVYGTWSRSSGEFVRWLGGQDICDVTIEKPDLEDLFMAYYSGSDTRGERVRGKTLSPS